MTKRRRISTTMRVAIFARHNGRCDICGGLITPGEAWDVSHRIPLELGGADDESNWFPAHRKCHRVETATKDVPNISRAKRRAAAHIGAKVRNGPQIKSRGFPKFTRKKPAATKSSLPPRSFYR